MTLPDDSQAIVSSSPVGYDSIGRDGTVITGRRKEFHELASRLVDENADLIRQELSTPDVRKLFLDALKAGLVRRERHCINEYSRIMRLAGEEYRVVMEFAVQFGASSPDHLRKMVDMAKSVEGVGPHDGAERCASYLEAYLNAFPEQRQAVIRRLGGYVPVG
jgi:hypothetical protein